MRAISLILILLTASLMGANSGKKSAITLKKPVVPESQYQHDIGFMFTMNYQKDTIEGYETAYDPWISYRYFLTPHNGVTFQSSFFIDTLLKLSFTDDISDYQGFYKQERTFCQLNFGAGWRHHHKRYQFSTFGGLKLYMESITREVNQNGAPTSYSYGSTDHFLIDTGAYLGVDAGLILGKRSLKNEFMLKIVAFYDHFIRLNEHRFYGGVSLNYLF